MSKWRKKPVIIDAYDHAGYITDEPMPGWVSEAYDTGFIFKCHYLDGMPPVFGYTSSKDLYYVKTLEGNHLYDRNTDVLIRGVCGEIYPCKRDIFLETYESAETAV